MRSFLRCDDRHCYRSPLQLLGRGLAAGMGATLFLSLLARIMPGMLEYTRKEDSTPKPPSDPNDRDAVREWQVQSWSPAAHQQRPPQDDVTQSKVDVTPAHALVQPEAPGPEGLAEQFAFKVASGLFDRDISGAVRPAGLAVHFLYGTAWGGLYGLLRGSAGARSKSNPVICGGPYGLLVWLFGPATLVPAMKIMRPPTQEPPIRNATLILGHILYGACLAALFGVLTDKEP